MEFDISTKLDVMSSTLRSHREFEPLIILVGAMKDDMETWRQVYSLFIEKTKRVEDETANREFQGTTNNGYLAQTARNVQQDRNALSQQTIECFTVR